MKRRYRFASRSLSLCSAQSRRRLGRSRPRRLLDPAPGADPARSGQALIDALPEAAVLVTTRVPASSPQATLPGSSNSRGVEEVQNYDFTDELKREENTCNAPTAAFSCRRRFDGDLPERQARRVQDGVLRPRARRASRRAGTSAGDRAALALWSLDGRWERDTLVVDTKHLTAGTFMNNGFNHSEELHMGRALSREPRRNTLWLVQTYEDPRVFAASPLATWRGLAGAASTSSSMIATRATASSDCHACAPAAS